MIPLLHDFRDETVLVFGGGPVGARKARRFAHEAEVLVVSPTFADRDFGGAELIRAAPEPGANGDGDGDGDRDEDRSGNGDGTDDGDVAAWLERTDPALVVAATDDETVNAAVERAARDRGVLVNRADESGERDAGSVVVPATVREDPVVVSIATGGAAPALSKYLRRELEGTLAGAGEMADLCRELRTELKSSDVSPERRHEIVTAVVNSPDVWTALRDGASNTRQVIEDVLGDELPTGTWSGGDEP